MKIKNKKGIALNEGVYAVLTVVSIAALVIIALYVFVSIQNSPIATVSAISGINESGWINVTGYTLLNSTVCGFSSPSITSAINGSSGALITSPNWTISSGIISNASSKNWDKVNMTYTYTWGSAGCQASRDSITQFATFPALVGLIGTIVLLGLVIGILVASFSNRRIKA